MPNSDWVTLSTDARKGARSRARRCYNRGAGPSRDRPLFGLPMPKIVEISYQYKGEPISEARAAYYATLPNASKQLSTSYLNTKTGETYDFSRFASRSAAIKSASRERVAEEHRAAAAPPEPPPSAPSVDYYGPDTGEPADYGADDAGYAEAREYAREGAEEVEDFSDFWVPDQFAEIFDSDIWPDEMDWGIEWADLDNEDKYGKP